MKSNNKRKLFTTIQTLNNHIHKFVFDKIIKKFFFVFLFFFLFSHEFHF